MKYIKLFEDFETEDNYTHTPFRKGNIIKPTESDFKYFKYDKNKFIDYVIRANNLVDMGKMMKKVNEEFKNEVHNLPGKIFDLKEMVEKFLDKVGIEYSHYYNNASYLYDGTGKDLGKFSFEISNKVIDTEDGPRRVGIIIPLLGMGGYFSNMDEFSTYITARYGIDMGKVMKKINQ